jgi:NifU-like protein involved in Fe-S cluster formation
MEYSAEIQRRLSSPGRYGGLQADGAGVVTTEAEDRSLNVWVRFQVQLQCDSIRSVRFEAYGCPHFLAGADWMAEHLEGASRVALREPLARAACKALGVPIEKLGKLLVLEDALLACARVTDDRVTQ